jgi:hypothetical protein
MSSHFHTLASQKSTSTARAASGSTVLVPFSYRGRRPAKVGPAPLTSEWSSAKAAIRPVPAATGKFAADRFAPSGIIIDFAQVRRSGHAARIREERSNENQNSLTLADLAAIVYVTMATALYPALVWFLIRS